MRKFIKRIILMTACLAFIGLGNVFAQDASSITIDNAQKDQTYNFYEIFQIDLGTSSGSSTTYAYTITSNFKNLILQKEGSDYTYLIPVSQNNPGDLNIVTIDGVSYWINITENNKVQFLTDAVNYIKDQKISPDKTQKASIDGAMTVYDLTTGYYLVNMEGNGTQAGFCALTSADDHAILSLKQDYPSLTKTVTNAVNGTVRPGQVINYQIDFIIPNTEGYVSYTYNIDDVLGSGLSLNKDSFEIYQIVDGQEVPLQNIFNPGSDKITDINTDSVITSMVKIDADNSNHFTLPLEITSLKIGNNVSTGATLRLKYTAKVLAQQNGEELSKNNSATISFSQDALHPDELLTTETETVELYTVNVNLTKTDPSGNPLSGASFQLYRKDDNQYYQIDSNGEVSWGAESSATTFTSGSDGLIYIKGLTNGTYELVETVAPSNYSKLSGSVELNVATQSAANGGLLTDKVSATVRGQDVSVTRKTGTNGNESAYEVSFNLINTQGSSLPETGGMGTKILYGIGIVLVLTTFVLLMTKKRMQA